MCLIFTVYNNNTNKTSSSLRSGDPADHSVAPRPEIHPLRILRHFPGILRYSLDFLSMRERDVIGHHIIVMHCCYFWLNCYKRKQWPMISCTTVPTKKYLPNNIFINFSHPETSVYILVILITSTLWSLGFMIYCEKFLQKNISFCRSKNNSAIKVSGCHSDSNDSHFHLVENF